LTIFISIASYRDPELVPTIQDCLSKARDPSRLRFGVCWQHGEDERLPPAIKDDVRIRILDVDWRESKGACWARAQIMSLWEGEDYFLQIDSHHRFAEDWDAKLIQNGMVSGSSKPILTTYCPAYVPGDEDKRRNSPTRMDFDYFTEDGIALFKPAFLDVEPNWRPVKARFVSGHFLFAQGSFVQEVPYDPHLYFLGEETTLAIRAYTWGYDLFHPTEALLWHEYSRSNRRKHWDDHVEGAPVERVWYERDRDSRERIRRFLTAPSLGPLGCGGLRTFEQYCAYAGIDFIHRKVQDYTRRGLEPPNPPASERWELDVQEWNVKIELNRSRLPAEAFSNSLFWYVGIHDASGAEIDRHDLCGDELASLIAGSQECILVERRFQSGQQPETWTVWPVTQNMVWLKKAMGRIPHSSSPYLQI